MYGFTVPLSDTKNHSGSLTTGKGYPAILTSISATAYGVVLHSKCIAITNGVRGRKNWFFNIIVSRHLLTFCIQKFTTVKQQKKSFNVTADMLNLTILADSQVSIKYGILLMNNSHVHFIWYKSHSFD